VRVGVAHEHEGHETANDLAHVVCRTCGQAIEQAQHRRQIGREPASVLLSRRVPHRLRQLLHVDAPPVGTAIEALHREHVRKLHLLGQLGFAQRNACGLGTIEPQASGEPIASQLVVDEIRVA